MTFPGDTLPKALECFQGAPVQTHVVPRLSTGWPRWPLHPRALCSRLLAASPWMAALDTECPTGLPP